MLARTLSRSARVAPRGARAMSSIEWFPKIGKIPYDPTSRNPLVFKHYNAEEVIAGKVRAAPRKAPHPGGPRAATCAPHPR